MNIIKSTVAAAVLAFGGLAQAAPYYINTINQWSLDGAQVDADGDTQWSILAYDTFLGTSTISMDELDVAGVDYYTMTFDFLPSPIQNASYSLEYVGQQLGNEYFGSAHLDSTHAGVGTSVTKQIFDNDTGALLLTLISTDGNPAEGFYAATKNIRIVETYSAGPNGALSSSENTFDVIPAPLTPALLGMGLVGLGWMRRRQSK